MPFFPQNYMPRKLLPETIAEIDNSPMIFNARDANILTRELIAIERLMGVASDGRDTTMFAILREAYQLLRQIADGSLAGRTSGVLPLPASTSAPAGLLFSGAQVPVPPGLNTTMANGDLLPAATTVAVVSTTGFPSSGFITKFNDTTILFDSIGHGSASQFSNYELISYTGTTPTSFTGCVRSIEGTGQEVLAGKSAVIIGGRASLSLGHAFWGTSPLAISPNTPSRITVMHSADLSVSAILTGTPSSSFKSSLVEAAYSLTVFGSFSAVSIQKVLDGQ